MLRVVLGRVAQKSMVRQAEAADACNAVHMASATSSSSSSSSKSSKEESGAVAACAHMSWSSYAPFSGPCTALTKHQNIPRGTWHHVARGNGRDVVNDELRGVVRMVVQARQRMYTRTLMHCIRTRALMLVCTW